MRQRKSTNLGIWGKRTSGTPGFPSAWGNWGVGLILLSATLSVEAESPSIPWMSDYAAAIDRAKIEGKPVFIDFTAEWCGWCKRLDDEVYADAAIAKALKNFVCLKIDVDKQTNVALAYNVQSMPRAVVLNVHGEIVGDLTGYLPLGPYLKFLSGLKDDLTRKTGGTVRPEVRDRTEATKPDKPAINSDTPTDEVIALLGDRDPAVRNDAIRVISGKPDRLRILVAALGSEHLGARITALESLRKSGAKEIEFDPWAPKAERETALRGWQQWLDQIKPEHSAATPQ